MTCAQGLLRLLWGGGPKLECYGTGDTVLTYQVSSVELVTDKKLEAFTKA